MINFRVDGKLALVTGSSRGIGLSIAKALAEAGADIIGIGSKEWQTGSELEREVTTAGRKFYGYACDLSDRNSIYTLVKQLDAKHPVIDILVNNAGNILREPAAQHRDEYWDNIININLDAPFILTRELGRKMVERGSGKIVFTCSLLSFQGGINVPGYAASKGAIASLLKAFANEWARFGVNVNGIAPGYIATDNTAALRADEERNAAILARIPANRWGQPEDLAGAFVFLCSPASDYMNGTIITVDGGWMGR